MTKRVLLGMSGGTDSSTAILYLREAGYEVVGVTFLFSGSESSEGGKRAAVLAKKLKVEHHVIELRTEFSQIVVDYFVDEYCHARTPFPCVVCNKYLKWPQLQRLADQLKCHKISTGHYAGIANYHGYPPLFQKAPIPIKIKVFFLWSIPTHLLENIVFPLEEQIKTEVRQKAHNSGLSEISSQKDSMGICFLDEPDYPRFFEKSSLRLTKLLSLATLST